MRNFKKTDNNLLICEECGEIVKSVRGLGRHINCKHNSKIYYDKWLKEENEGICKICGKETAYRGLCFRYKNYCSDDCYNEWLSTAFSTSTLNKYKVKNAANIPGIQEKKKQTCFEKYGTEISSQSEIVKNKTKQNNIKKYGVENIFQIESIKNKCKIQHIKNLGVEHPSKSNKIKEKKKETCLKNYGVSAGFADVEKRNKTMKQLYGDNPLTNEIIKNKKIQTSLDKYNTTSPNKSIIVKNNKKEANLKKYGVEHPMQTIEIFNKHQKNSMLAHKYMETDLYYRGSYELDFLEKYYSKFQNLENGKPINYKIDGIFHYYFPDFYIPSLNLIIEIKSKYYYNKFKKLCLAKKRYTIKSSFKYLLLIDKNYNTLNKIINENTKMQMRR